jgi:hypothetical protein
MVVKAGETGPKLPGHLKFEVQPSLKLASPVYSTWRKVLGHYRDVEVLEDAVQSSLPVRLVLNFEGKQAKVAEGSGAVALLVILI